ncbi:unnamed protein product, partial [Clonostachys chloroleuca]
MPKFCHVVPLFLWLEEPIIAAKEVDRTEIVHRGRHQTYFFRDGSLHVGPSLLDKKFQRGKVPVGRENSLALWLYSSPNIVCSAPAT